MGNIILATGYKTFDPHRMPQYGYGRLANVFTSLEFERMCNASAGPSGGQILLRDGKTQPQVGGRSFTAWAVATRTTTPTVPTSAACRR